MTTLIISVSSGKGTWSQVSSLINAHNWEKVIVICNEFSYDKFEISPSKALKLKLDEKNPQDSVKNLSNVLTKEVKDLEVALNISSGQGFEHMILLTAILRAGLGPRFIYYENKEIKELELFDGPFITDEENNL